jgi:transposase
MQITTIGLDIAKNVFQVHGIDAAEKVVVRKQLRRGQVIKFFAALPLDSTGGKQKLGPISKQGDRYLRPILVVGAHSVLRRAKHNPEKYPWLTQLLARRPFKVVAIALANKMARVAWALLARGGTYRVPALAAA